LPRRGFGIEESKDMNNQGVQVYDFTLSPGGSQGLPASGSFYRVITSTGAVSVRENNAGKVGPISAGQGMRNRDFDSLIIKDESGAANRGTIIVAGSDFVDDRITGEVSTIDGGKARSLAGAGMCGYVGQGGQAGTQAQVQLWNKSTDRNLIINACSIAGGAQTTTNISAFLTNVAQASLVYTGVNKKANGPTSGNAELRYGTVAPGNGPGVGYIMRQWWGGALTLYEWRMTEPIIVPPGYGLSFHHWGVATDLNAGFEWWEEFA
jgi:hypothetical protein